MKKMFGLVVALLILYIAFQVAYSYVFNRQINSYSITVGNNQYKVKEVYTARHKSPNLKENDKNNYYYEINSGDKLLFSFKLAGNYTGVKEFLDNLLIYKNGSLTCAYPVFKGKVKDIDVVCNDGDKYYLYAVLKGQYAGLDSFVQALKMLGYQHPSWAESNTLSTKIGAFDFYSNNITDDQNVIIWAYNGFYRLTSRSNKFFPLNGDVQYEPSLVALVNQYYVIPDYKSATSFSRIFVTNLISGSMEAMDIGATISYDSFVQGVVDNKIYIIDRSSRIQYSLDIYNKETKLAGDASSGSKYYYNGQWESKTIYEAIYNNLFFSGESSIPNNLKAYNYLYANSVGGETDGYYYLYIQEGSVVNVYRVDKQNSSIMTMMFKIPSVNNIKYSNGDICFVSGDTLYTYRADLGLRPLVRYNEFSSNKRNLYSMYVNE